MRASTLAASLLAATLATASPIANLPRAGAPSYVPITPPCSVSYPLSSSPSNATVAYAPAAALTAAHKIYSWDRPLSDEAYVNATTLWSNCVEQCNGLDGCVSAFLAYNVPGESHYGGPAGNPSIGCRMYDVAVRESDFVGVANGTYERAVAGVIGGEGCQN